MANAMQTVGIAFFLNGREVAANVTPGQTALQLLRGQFGLTGTKEGCNEGDCGACTVAIGRWDGGGREFRYRAHTSCLVPAARLHGTHVITIEGLGIPENLHPIQRAFLDSHATQCGFCTPGFIMSLFCLYARNPDPSRAQIGEALEGNLCRCTGYESIFRAAASIAGVAGQILPPYHEPVAQALAGFDRRLSFAEAPLPQGAEPMDYHRPETLERLFDLLWRIGDCERYRIIAGGTDVVVDANVKRLRFRHLVDIAGIPGLSEIRGTDRGVSVGALATLTDVTEHRLVSAKLPLLRAVVSRMASLQVRNSGTLAGNLATASPIGDAATAALALDATLVLATKMGERRVPAGSFFKGYRRTELCAHELITAIEFPEQDGPWDFRKSAKRGAVDISSVCTAMTARLDGSKVAAIRIACGGAAATPVLLAGAAAAVLGRELAPAAIEQAAQAAAAEVAPIDDVRGSRQFRSALVRNHVVEHLSKLL